MLTAVRLHYIVTPDPRCHVTLCHVSRGACHNTVTRVSHGVRSTASLTLCKQYLTSEDQIVKVKPAAREIKIQSQADHISLFRIIQQRLLDNQNNSKTMEL